MRKEKRAKENKTRIKPITKLILCLVVVLVIVGGFVVYDKFIKPSNNKVKVVDSIKNEDVDYVVNENDTKLFKDNFNELKKVLNAKEIDNEEYAKVLAKLFVIDFFTLSNKTSKNDVGGVQFVFESYKKDFVDGARDSMYKQVKSTVSDENANKSLPTVSKIKVDTIDTVSPFSMFETGGFTEDQVGYIVNISWNYKNDDEFQSNATLIIVPDGTKLSVAKMQEAM